MVFDCTSQTSFKSFRIITTSTLVTRTSTSSPLSREATPTTTKRSTLLSIHLLSSYEITFSTTTMLTSVTPIPSIPSCENNTRNQTDRHSIYIPNSFIVLNPSAPTISPITNTATSISTSLLCAPLRKELVLGGSIVILT